MFVVLLKFGSEKARAPQFMDGHKDWLRGGFEDGVFLLSGSLRPDGGGAIFAHGTSRADLEARIALDPFVEQGIVTAEILEVSPSRVHARLDFLSDQAP